MKVLREKNLATGRYSVNSTAPSISSEISIESSLSTLQLSETASQITSDSNPLSEANEQQRKGRKTTPLDSLNNKLAIITQKMNEKIPIIVSERQEATRIAAQMKELTKEERLKLALLFIKDKEAAEAFLGVRDSDIAVDFVREIIKGE
jgi:hypothetical protein